MATSRQCTSCQWIENADEVIGGVLATGKCSKWRVNHHQGKQAVIGWLVLQPVEHKLTLDKLSHETLNDLGSALGSVQRGMKRVWGEIFPDDPLERIHTVSFMESEFDRYDSPQGSRSSFHVHIFLIPRSQELGKVIRLKLDPASKVVQYVPWHDYLIFGRIKKRDACDLTEKNIPWDKLQRYINPDGEAGKNCWDDKIKNFMNRLRDTMLTC